jgi:cob(I)alamin adenosyltransferase
MGHRLTRIYTRTGDDGSTGLGDGQRVPKDDPRVEAYGTVDEANSAIGVLLAADGIPGNMRECLLAIQHDLFDVGAELCIPGHRVVTDEHVGKLEEALDSFNDTLPPLKDFILPGGNHAAATCHLARTIVRRAERRVWTLSQTSDVAAEVPRYLNRLSDLLFVMARLMARQSPAGETLWRRKPPVTD